MRYHAERRLVASRIRLAIGIFLALALPAGVFDLGLRRSFAQTFTASLSGTVKDPSGAAVPSISLALRNQDTNATRDTVSGPDGRYTFSQLAPGTYELTAKGSGFKTYLEKDIVLLASHAATLDVNMQLGQVSQSVEVTGQAPLLDTESATQSSTLSTTMIRELPLDVRNPLALVFTQAAATPGIFGGASSLGNFDQEYSGFSLKGSRSMGSLILLDGAPDTAADWGGLLVAPSVESVQEFQVIDNTYDAQYGKTEGGVVSLVTRSGTNSFHGEVYDFFRNDNLDANSWSNNTNGATRPEFKRNQFGANFGGPMWRSKRLYFFGSYEGLRQPYSSSSGVQTVPTAAQRMGDFSSTYNSDGSLAVLYNPFTTTPDPNNPGQYLRQPFDASCVGVTFPNTCPGNVIPSGLLNAVGQKVVALYPNANLPGDPITGINNYYAVGSGSQLTDRIDGRVDWSHSSTHNMYVRWSQRVRQNNNTPDFYGNGAEDLNFKSDKNPGYQGVWGNTFTPSANWVINVMVETGRWNESQISPATGKLTPASVGLNPAEFQAQLLPNFAPKNYQDLGDQQIRNFIRYTNSLQVNATRQHGDHSVKFGFYGESALVNNIDREAGSFDFGRGMTSGPVAQIDSSSTGNSIASLLLGAGSGGGAPLNPDLAASMRYYGVYGQDTWHATPKLTLIYGLRYEVQPGATERFNRWSVFDPNLTNPLAAATGLPLKGGFVFANSSNRGLWPTDEHNFAPRVGFAYKITNKLVARGGFGIFYMPAQALITFDSPGQSEGFSSFTSWVATVNGFQPTDLINNPFPSGPNPPTGRAGGAGTSLGQSLGQVWLKAPHPTGYQQNYSLNFQYELSPGRAVEVGYAGFRARKLMYGNPSLNMDEVLPQDISLGSALFQNVTNPFAGLITTGDLSGPTVPLAALDKPFPTYTDIEPARSLPGAKANFDSLSVKFTQQFKSGLSLLSTYQWSKTLDDGSEDQGWSIWNSQWRDYYNRKIEYSISSHDVPQSFVTSLVYDLPVGRGKKYGSSMSGVADRVIGGWQLSTIVALHSGLPLIIGAPANNLQGLGFGRAAANLVSTRLLHVPNRTPDNWFNGCTQQPNGDGTISMVDCAPGQAIAWTLPACVTGSSCAASFQIGNAPRFIPNLRTDWTRNTDLSLSKFFRVTEAVQVQFRADFLNAWNTPVFGGADGFVTSSTFNNLFSTVNNPRNIQFALKVRF